MQHTAHSTRHATRDTQHATRNTQHATRNTQHATRNTQHSQSKKIINPYLEVQQWLEGLGIALDVAEIYSSAFVDPKVGYAKVSDFVEVPLDELSLQCAGVDVFKVFILLQWIISMGLQ